MIIQAEETLLPQIYKLLDNIKDAPKANLSRMMKDGLSNLNEIILAYLEDYTVKGFLYATVDKFDGERSVFIQAAYMEPNKKYLGVTEAAFDKLCYWAKQKGINRMDIITTRVPEAFQRRWGFAYTGTLMKRRI